MWGGDRTTVVGKDTFRKEGIGGQVTDIVEKKADLVEINRMDQNSERMVPVQDNTINMPELRSKPAAGVKLQL